MRKFLLSVLLISVCVTGILTSSSLELEDTIYPQYFLLSPDDIKVAEGDEITFRFVIEDVYPGTLYEDTCLTGLVMEFTGRHGH